MPRVLPLKEGAGIYPPQPLSRLLDTQLLRALGLLAAEDLPCRDRALLQAEGFIQEKQSAQRFPSPPGAPEKKAGGQNEKKQRRKIKSAGPRSKQRICRENQHGEQRSEERRVGK